MRHQIVIGVALTGLIAAGACQMVFGHKQTAEEKEFQTALGKTTLTVFPTVVRMGKTTQTDEGSAGELAAFFVEKGLGKAVVREEPVVFALKGSFNQAKMYRQSKAAFQAYVRAHPPGTPYAAMAEYLLSSSGQVGGIHLYVVRADGEPVGGVLLNSHWKEFREVKPKTAAEATRALLLRLDRKWKPATSSTPQAPQS